MVSTSRRTLLGLLPATLLAGQGAAQQTAPADGRPAPLPPGQTRTVKVAVGGLADVTHLAVWYPKYAGFFDALKPAGINVEVIPFTGGSEWLLALTSGQVDIAHGYYENGVRARAQGRDVVLIDNVLPTPVFTIIVRAGLADQVRSIKDVKGLTWGFTSFGSATHVVSLRIAKAAGLAQSDVHWVSIGGTNGYLPSIREKRVDILTTSLFYGKQLIGEGSGKELKDMVAAQSVESVYGHPYMGPGILTSRAYCAKEPFAVLSVETAIRRAIAKAKSEPAAAIAKILPAEFQSEYLVASIGPITEAFTSDGTVPLAAATAMCQDMTDLKVGRGGVEPADTFDNRFVRWAEASA